MTIAVTLPTIAVDPSAQRTSISGQFMAIHVDPNKSAQRTTSRLCFSQECPVIYRNFSRIIFLTIPGPFPTIPDHNTVRPADSNDFL